MLNTNVKVSLQNPISSATTEFVCNDAMPPFVRPQASTYEQSRLFLVDSLDSPTRIEVIRYLNRSIVSNNLVVLHEIKRGQDGTTPIAFPAGSWLVSEASMINYAVYTAEKIAAECEFATENNGFYDNTETTLSFDDGTRTLTLGLTGAEATYLSNDTKYTMTVAKTSQIPDAEGLHFFYLNGDDLLNTQTYSENFVTTQPYVAALYWDATNSTALQVVDQRHENKMDPATRIWAAAAVGAAWTEGLKVNFLNIDAGVYTTDDVIQLTVEDGTIVNEDLEITIAGGTKNQTLAPIAELPIYYRLGAVGVWRTLPLTQFTVYENPAGSNRAMWNEWTGATWQLSEMPNNDWGWVHIAVSGALEKPVFVIMGQAIYNNKTEAESGLRTELSTINSDTLGNIADDIKIIGSALFVTNGGRDSYAHSSFHTLADGETEYRDWRFQRIAKETDLDRPFAKTTRAIATEDLAAGDFVALYDAPGGSLQPQVKKASAVVADGARPVGFVLNAYLTGDSVDIYLPGEVNDAITPTGFVTQYLDAGTPGAATGTKPTTDEVWILGYAVDENSPGILFSPQFVEDLT